MTVVAHLGVGSNVGERAATIASARRSLGEHPAISVIAVSTLHETEPVGPVEQPPFLNAAFAVATSLAPRALLEACQAVEAAHGRDRSGEQRWGPRRLDLDVLLYADAVVDEPGLRIPHPRLLERAFALEPLAEVAPAAIHPLARASIECLRDRLRNASGRVLGT